MKRSRACDDLVALAADASAHSSGGGACALRRGVDAWTPYIEGPTHRFKRSRAAVDSPSSSGDEADDQERRSLQFMLEMNENLECLSAEVTLSSSAPSRASISVLDDDSLPLRRNSRENMLLRKKKQRIAEVTSSFNDFGIHDEDRARRTLHSHPTPRLARPQAIMETPETPETPETRILRGLCFPRESRCIDPLDKRQTQSFDMSAFIMLSISPKR
ncbi:hypothetical protein PHYPSEUDO_002285 [Phytophthora pseudosyringae]|uniref:Uncharacterized protein n=1 Tax=Phytophthora pseudosyringae TaxID=221518 RepID=A0A8T1V5C5_9STRA|nr:hypothetical protein PHYPSEUDO_002285 [Phytophthora pseudosyringae]